MFFKKNMSVIEIKYDGKNRPVSLSKQGSQYLVEKPDIDFKRSFKKLENAQVEFDFQVCNTNP
jgi:hypothetical protein